MNLSGVRTFLLFLLSSFFLFSAPPKQSYVTYEFSGGRFGDNLLAYLHAKWISYKYHLPLLYKPFPYSAWLKLDELEMPYSARKVRSLHRSSCVKSSQTTPYFREGNYLYICPYFPESEWERAYCVDVERKPWAYFNMDWKDPEFRKIAIEMIQPKNPPLLISPLSGKISIALHYREGGGYEKLPTNDPSFAAKAPPMSYYVEGLFTLISLFKDKPLYCHVFTDANDPSALVEQLKEYMPAVADITFACRSQNNSHDTNVLEDFFSLPHFDALIRPDSNFSLIPALLFDFAAVVSPSIHFTGPNGTFRCTARLETNQDRLAQLR